MHGRHVRRSRTCCAAPGLRRDRAPGGRRRRRRGPAGPVGSERLNARGTVNVLEAARRLASVASSTPRRSGSTPTWTPATVDEDTALIPPAHLYTATKLAGELYCRSYRELYGVDVDRAALRHPLRPARAARRGDADLRAQGAGRGAADDRRRRLADAPLRLRRGPRRGRRRRARAAGRADRTYNLVGDEDVTIREIAETVRRRGRRRRARETEGRAGDFSGAEVSGARAAAELGWTATTPFAEGLRRYVAWHRDAGDAERMARRWRSRQSHPRRRSHLGRRVPAARVARRAH